VGQFVERLARKARGIVGLGLVGAGVGLLGGGLWGLVTTVLNAGWFWDANYWQFVFSEALNAATFWALPAAFASSGFGLLVAALDGRRSLTELPLWRMTLFGAVGGALFIPAYLLRYMGWEAVASFPLAMLPQVGLFAVMGGGLTASLTVLAKRAQRAELQAVRAVVSLADTS